MDISSIRTPAIRGNAGQLGRAGVRAWMRWLAKARLAWKAYWRERAERHLDTWYVQHRAEHERYLGRARDVYELERLERAFERRESWGMRP